MAIAREKKEIAEDLIPDNLNSSYSQSHMPVIFPRISLIGAIPGRYRRFRNSLRRLDGNEAKSFRAGASDPVVFSME